MEGYHIFSSSLSFLSRSRPFLSLLSLLFVAPSRVTSRLELGLKGMAFIRCRTFLGCLPLASGVWLLSLVGLMLGASGAVGSWIEINLMASHPLPLQDEIAQFVQAIVFSLLGLFSILGFAEGISQNRNFAFIYCKLVAIHYAIIIGAFAFTLYSTFRHVDSLTVASCIQGDLDQFVIQFCNKGWSFVKGLPIIWYSVVLLVQAYAYILAVNFAEKLDIDDISRISKHFTLTSSDGLSFYSKDVEYGMPDIPSATFVSGGRYS
ncbi:hypothetical protein EDD18DRAFT_633922 [Armillaria luteobubalina]|uniref:Uncharacterized protein n=1 Tax=Armillaria luteobubalina TaxID=153913 RepID=A0AA39TY10_9AGAR|nr:hypothetical protein EDD18DRAFT_633922 [Armillaria luteobubalina]